MTALECIAAARESIAASKALQIKIRRERPDARTVGGEIGDAIERKLASDVLSRKHREAWEKWRAKKGNAQAPAQREEG
jgi:hypothetical protein